MKKHELIEKYFSNQLSDEEFGQLEQILEKDDQLRDELYNELEVKRAIVHEKHSTLKNRLQELDQNTKKKTRWIPYAAAIALLIGIGSILYAPGPDYQGLYADTFEVYPNVINLVTRGGAEPKNSETIAFELYDAGNYDEAVRAFDSLYKKHPKDYLLFYKGVGLLAQDRTEEGIQALQSYDWELDGSDFTTASNWYLGLAHLKQEQVVQAKLFLEKVAASESNLNTQAQELLKHLD
ncbi:MAG: tetratricopeptide repeat protein [Algicola sp.]|nr:tetratricopeptide repeat protein [Algicola sp.]